MSVQKSEHTHYLEWLSPTFWISRCLDTPNPASPDVRTVSQRICYGFTTDSEDFARDWQVHNGFARCHNGFARFHNGFAGFSQRIPYFPWGVKHFSRNTPFNHPTRPAIPPRFFLQKYALQHCLSHLSPPPELHRTPGSTGHLALPRAPEHFVLF